MKKALSLAAKGKGMCHPNPMVGAVIAREGDMVGSGYHHGPYTPHAEIEALGKAGERAAGAVLYVTLEPCNHQGRTPPCTEAILRAGVDRVVIAAMDPNPGVRGGGADRMRAAGLKVDSGLMAEESSRLNSAYEKYVLTGKPLVTVKMAATADGKVAARGGASKWITGEKARREVHAMRRESDAVLVGKGTVEIDDPELTVRMVPMRGARPPARIIVDSRLEISADSRLARGGKPHVIVATTPEHDRAKADDLSARGVEVLVVPERGGRVDLDQLLAALGEREIAQLLVEGGPVLVASFFEQGLADRLALFIAPKVFGDRMAPSWIEGLEVTDPRQAITLSWSRVRKVGDDLLLEGEIQKRE